MTEPATTTEIRNFIGGAHRATADGGSEAILDPATGETIATAPLSGEADVDAAVAAGQDAFEAWSQTPPAERAHALLRIADAIEARGEELVGVESRDVGKPISGGARGAAVHRRQPALLRRRRTLHGGPRRRRVHGRLHVDAAPRGAGRRRPGGALELPADDGDLEDRPRARGRQHRRAQAVRADADDDRAARRDRRRAPAARAS